MGVLCRIHGDLRDHAQRLISRHVLVTTTTTTKKERKKARGLTDFISDGDHGTEFPPETFSNPRFIFATDADEKKHAVKIGECIQM